MLKLVVVDRRFHMHLETLQLIMVLKPNKNFWPSESIIQEILGLQQESQQEEESNEDEEESEDEDSGDDDDEDYEFLNNINIFMEGIWKGKTNIAISNISSYNNIAIYCSLTLLPTDVDERIQHSYISPRVRHQLGKVLN